MNYPIYIAPEVEQLLGPDFAALARRPTQASYKCPGCDRQGRFDEPSCVVILTGPDVPPTVRYAHRHCMTSSVRDGLPRPFSGWADAVAAAGLLRYGSGFRPVLVVERVGRAVALARPGEPVEVVMSGIQGLGLTLLPNLIAPAPPAPGWRLELPGPDRVRVVPPGGGAFYDGAVPQPEGWRVLVTASGRAELLSGVIGMAAAEQEGPDGAMQALHDAAQAGMLAGATIALAAASLPRRT
jgi:hypothetical protein